MPIDKLIDGNGGLLPEETEIEQTLAVMFIDVQGFSQLTNGKGPEATVSLLNSVFEAIGNAVMAYDGWIDGHLGDGQLVVFGINKDTQTSCRLALSAIKRIERSIGHINAKMGKKLSFPLRVGIGLSVGPTIIGKIGHSKFATLKAIGPTVNTAIKLEELTKGQSGRIIISNEVVENAQVKFTKQQTEFVIMRDMQIPVEVLRFQSGADIPKIR